MHILPQLRVLLLNPRHFVHHHLEPRVVIHLLDDRAVLEQRVQLNFLPLRDQLVLLALSQNVA